MTKQGAKWFVLLTKPKNELKVASLLTAKQLPVFVPTRTEVRQWSDRKKKSSGPLIAVDGVGAPYRARGTLCVFHSGSCALFVF